MFDIRLVLRSLRRNPGFAALSIFIVALGAGANASVFSVVRAVLIEPLPYARPAELAAIWPGAFVSSGDMDFLRARGRSFAEVASTSPGWTMSLLGAGDPVRVTATKTSANLFDLLGVRPLMGRTFARDEDRPGQTHVAILSYQLWRSQFHGDPTVLGRMVTLEGAPHQIVGVMGEDFELFGRDAELWMPLPMDRTSAFWKGTVSQALGRLRRGTTLDDAARELRALVPGWRRELGYAADWHRGDVPVGSLREAVVGEVRSSLLVLLAAVGLILMLTAANLGTLLLGRHVARRREMAVRGALGASGWRLVRQTGTESLILAAAGGLAGLVAARLTLFAVVRLLPPEMPRLASIGVDPVVVTCVLAVSMLSVLGFGTLPSFLAVRPTLQPLLRLGAQSDTRTGRRMLDALVVGQLALATVLGIGAALMLRSLVGLQHVNPGFEANQVLTFKLEPFGDRVKGLARSVAYYDEILERVAAVPGVAGVAAINHLPLSGYNWVTSVRLDDRAIPPGVTPPSVGWRMIRGPYFDVMRIPVLAGRTFTSHDTAASPAVALVNDAFARTFCGSAAAAVGHVIHTGDLRGSESCLIVGVVGGVRHVSLSSEPAPEMYRPCAQSFPLALALVVRATTSPASIVGAVRQAVWTFDRNVPIADMRPLTTQLADSLGRPRLLATLLLVFAAIGLATVLTGVYGVVAYSARRREREIGIRLALGAPASSISGLVVGQGVAYAVAGLAIGVPLAIALTRLMRGLLFGIQPGDPMTVGTLSALVAFATVAATLIPAWHVRHVDPASVLRAE